MLYITHDFLIDTNACSRSQGIAASILGPKTVANVVNAFNDDWSVAGYLNMNGRECPHILNLY